MQVLYSDEAVFRLPSRIPPEPSRRSRLFGGAASVDVGDREDIGISVAAGNYGQQGRTLGWTFADHLAGNRVSTAGIGKFVLLAHNTDTAEHTVIVTAAADATTGIILTQRRTIAPGDIAAFGSIVPNVWAQDDGYVWINSDSPLVRLAVLAPT
jgi:hypothetical protein